MLRDKAGPWREDLDRDLAVSGAAGPEPEWLVVPYPGAPGLDWEATYANASGCAGGACAAGRDGWLAAHRLEASWLDREVAQTIGMDVEGWTGAVAFMSPRRFIARALAHEFVR